ncbi:MAG: sulfatase family protein [Bacteroidales bacterium]
MKNYIFIMGLTPLAALAGCSDEKEEQKNPNIVYVLADDLGYGDLSSFNKSSGIKTPNLDLMAAEGIKFTDAYTSSAVCTPTRYGILTGRYNWRSRLKNGVLTGKSKALIPGTRTTVASLLKKSGYNTAFIGKWHLGWDWALIDPDKDAGEGWDPGDFDNIDFSKPVSNGPQELGFNYSFGHSGSLDMAPYVYVENGLATQVPEFETVDTGKYTWWRKGPTSADFIHEDVTPNFFRRTIDFISGNAGGEEPFFIYLALPSPHTPILPTEKWKDKSGLNPYGDFVMEIDYYMGQLLKAIEDAGIEENTLVIFTSDNGCSPEADFELLESKGHFPSHIFRGHKADIFEGGLRVPFIAKWPAVINEGSVSDEIISTVDLMATCAEIMGYDLAGNEGEDSYSLLPVFEGKTLDKSLREATVLHSINGSFAIRKGDWKLIMCPGSGGWSFPRPNNHAVIDTLPEVQLYNLKDDPAESINMQAEKPGVVEELKGLLKGYIIDGRSTPGAPQQNDSYDGDWWQIDF